MAGFEELGLRAEVTANAHEAGFEIPSTLQRSVIPVLRRGGNAIVHASSGSGITVAYALALLDRFAEQQGTKALVIVPTADRAERVAGTIAGLAHGTNARVAALTAAWSSASSATIVVASAEKLLHAIEESEIKLDDIEAVIVDGAATIAKLAGAQALETIVASLPREGQRIFISSEYPEELRKLAESHARKALHFPPRPAVPERERERAAPTHAIRYLVAAAERKPDQIARLARSVEGPITLLCRGSKAAQAAERAMRGRGFDAHAYTYDEFERHSADGHVFGYDAPFTTEQLTEKLRHDDVVVCERNELPHLKHIAELANIRLTAATMPASETDSLNAFRNEIRRAAREEDLAAQMLVIEPLFAELSPEEIAAAASALLRARRPMKQESGAAKGTKTWSRLFFSIGERDGVRPGDVVGAITGESGIKGEDVGRVEIRDTFSVIEIASNVADQVIRALNGTTMKNRALRVDYDRKTTAGGSRAPIKRGPKREFKREKPR
ncbi:MAG: DbpA RNA binding domain-containing protein [Gemmatimonadota bacterium]